jgi:hypothetical protein
LAVHVRSPSIGVLIDSDVIREAAIAYGLAVHGEKRARAAYTNALAAVKEASDRADEAGRVTKERHAALMAAVDETT